MLVEVVDEKVHQPFSSFTAAKCIWKLRVYCMGIY
jgi:hypothetical protein